MSVLESPSQIMNPPARTQEGVNVNNLLKQAQDNARGLYDDFEDYVREKPGTAILAATAVGYFLRKLPVGSIITAQVRLVSALLPPAVFVFGAAKLYEALKQEQKLP